MDTDTGLLRISMNIDSDWQDHGVLANKLLNLAESKGFTTTCRSYLETDESGAEYCRKLLLSGELVFRTESLDSHLPDKKSRERVSSGGNFCGVIAFPDYLAQIRYDSHSASFIVWAARAETAKAKCAELANGLPPPSQAEEPGLVKVNFWCNSAHGPRFYPRTIECPDWATIKSNYDGDVVQEIEWLRNLRRPDDHGRIIIWSGDPGTGKTWAIRSLVLSMKLRARIDVITDPQIFFADTDYVYRLLMDEDYMEQPLRLRRLLNRPMTEPSAASEEPSEDNFRLLILEDSAELIMAGCRDRNEGFTRLLNLADGLVGQGLRFLLLLTANEDLDEMDPAVLRHGRCLQNLIFPKLDYSKAQRWIKSKGHNIKLSSREHTLAELYAMLNDNRPKKVGSERRLAGFR